MSHLQKYGKAPYTLAVIHGGPGVAGYMSPVAEPLVHVSGVIEPFLSKDSIEGQLRELFTLLNDECKFPVTLIGHSWGAWLSFLFTARFPHLVNKLVLIGAGPFDEKYIADILEARTNRLKGEEKSEAAMLFMMLDSEDTRAGSRTLKRFGELMTKADSFDVLEGNHPHTIYHPKVYRKVWKEAHEIRHNGELLKSARLIRCPVLAIHGDYDPHPAGGVEYPLKKVLYDYRFELLERCGHYPWKEKYASDLFFSILIDFIKE